MEIKVGKISQAQGVLGKPLCRNNQGLLANLDNDLGLMQLKNKLEMERMNHMQDCNSYLRGSNMQQHKNVADNYIDSVCEDITDIKLIETEN